jgi:Xaa-Pro aminopeptidase
MLGMWGFKEEVEVKLEPNMMFSVEPGLYFPGEWGFNIENQVLITETGCEAFGTIQEDVDKPFGKKWIT